MGSTLSGIQCYGFDLGGVEDEWHLKDLGDDTWLPSWATPEQLAEEGGFDYENAINGQLASAELPLSIVTYGMHHNGFTGYVLAAWSTECTGSKTSPVHLSDVLARRGIERWDDALSRALKVLDIRPWQPHPMFLLTQSYG